jgi:hypothetical protein
MLCAVITGCGTATEPKTETENLATGGRRTARGETRPAERKAVMKNLAPERNAAAGKNTPETVRTAISMGIEEEIAARKLAAEAAGQKPDDFVTEEQLEELHREMLKAADERRYEDAAKLRDLIAKLKGQPVTSPQVKKPSGRRRGRSANP